MTQPAARTLAIAWYAIVGAPVVVLWALQTKFTMMSWVCATGQLWTVHMVSAFYLLATAAGVLLPYVSWRAHGSVRKLDEPIYPQWISFMLLLGIMVSSLSTLLMIAMWIPTFILGPCD